MDRYLALVEPRLSRTAAARLIREGRVTLDGRLAKPSELVRSGETVRVELIEAASLLPRPEQIPLDVVYDDGQVVVVNKAAGMVVHPGPSHATGTLVHALLGLGGNWSATGGSARPGIVHRLDKGTSGLILAARNDVVHRALAAQLADRTLTRRYLAMVRGIVTGPGGVLEGPIGRDPRQRLRMAVVEGGRPARTRFLVLEVRAGHTLLQCELESGRTHQIRVHLSALGYPLAGDLLYSRHRTEGPARPMLHAQALRFNHPTKGEQMRFEASLPADMEEFWESLR
ncbi:MAG TPA: RluA family pseudouridine synthase [Candidatus Acidoferrales bacterium]|nr:RluA family pseudouridine synthase [Candidatus Acidoferrales bacterium]